MSKASYSYADKGNKSVPRVGIIAIDEEANSLSAGADTKSSMKFVSKRSNKTPHNYKGTKMTLIDHMNRVSQGVMSYQANYD